MFQLFFSFFHFLFASAYKNYNREYYEKFEDKSFHNLSLKKRKIVKEEISSCYPSKSNFIPKLNKV